ncbi:MAG: 50S ribosomal protein L21 [Paracoccus sp. (in: a-proteobacteria)]|nr:50S ribosomal protein L21 [Paracoccus sp. (in: a-proteobacteria)]
MFAVLKTGGKQYKVQAGDVLRVEKLAANAGETVQFNDVLMIGATVGAPLVEGAAVQAEVIDQIKADKVITYVKRRRKHSSQRTRGHRQQLTLIRITDMLETGADKSGVQAAIGARVAGGEWVGQGTDRFAKNATEQAEMKARVASGEAGEKPAKPAKAAKAEKAKPAKADKAEKAKPAKAEKTKPAAEEPAAE